MNVQRAEFERWFVSCPSTINVSRSLERYADGTYMVATTEVAWQAWKALRKEIDVDKNLALNQIIAALQHYKNDDSIEIMNAAYAEENAMFEDLGGPFARQLMPSGVVFVNIKLQIRKKT